MKETVNEKEREFDQKDGNFNLTPRKGKIRIFSSTVRRLNKNLRNGRQQLKQQQIINQEISS